MTLRGIVPGTGGAGGAAISAGASSQNSGTIVFSNANSISFGLNNGTLTASISVTAAPSPVNVTGANGSSVNAQTIAFSNSNGVSLGVSTGAGGATITGSHNGLTGTGTSITGGASITFNSNGIAFNGSGLAGTTTAVTGRASITLNSAGMQFNGSGLAGTATAITGNAAITLNSSGISFNGASLAGTGTSATNASVTLNSNGLAISVAAPGAGGGIVAYDGANSITSGTARFTNANGVSFTFNGQTISGSVATTYLASNASTNYVQASAAFAGTNATGTIASNGISVSVPGTSSVSATGFLSISTNGATVSIGAGPLSFYAVSNTTQSTSGTIDGRSITFAGAGGASVGISNGSIIVSGGAGSGGGAAISAGANSQSTGTVNFSNSNGVTFGLSNNGVMTASVAGASAGVAAIYDGANSITSGTVRYTNANGVTFSFNGQTLSGSVATTYLGSNASTNYVQANAGFNGTGATGTIASNGISVSVPATSSLVGTQGLSVSTAGSTISVRPTPISRLFYPDHVITAVSAPGVGSMSIQYVNMPDNVSATRLDMLFAWSAGSSATTNTAAIALTVFGGIYTRNGATLSSISSGSTQTTYSYASNSAGTGNTGTAMRAMSIPINVDMSAGEYYVAMGWSSAASSIGLSTTNLGQTQSVMGGANLQTAVNWADWGSGTNATLGIYSGMGVYSAALSTVPPTISLSAINQTGAALSQANIALVFRNV